MSGLISRQDAIDALDEHFGRIAKLKRRGLNKGEKAISLDAVGVIKQLPPIQPEIIRCKDCKHRYIDGENVRFNVCELNHNKAQNDDWFCADAERKEGEADE